jgi:cell division protein FtsB
MPKKIYQDKERLYSEGLQLKQKLNELQEENIRLKTKISILEKERGKLTKVIDCAAESGHKSQTKFKAYQGPTPDK